MNINKINTFFEQKIEMNQRRYEVINKRYEEIMAFANDTDYIIKGATQGSFSTETFLKPIEENDLYDLDMILMVEEQVNVGNVEKITYYREKIQEDIESYARSQQWPKFEIDEKKYGFEIKFKSDLKIDVIPVFNNGKEIFIINYLDDMKPKFDEPFLLTELLIRSNNEVKTTLVQIIKFLKRANIDNKFENLQLLPSIATSILIMNETKKYVFSWENIAQLLQDIIKSKNAKLFNPFNSSEEFFGINGVWSENAKKYLIILDSIRLTIKKAIKDNDDSIIVGMLSDGSLVWSSGIDERPSGAGGHA